MGVFQSKNRFPVDGRTVLLTGGSDGMGRSIAIQLAKKGANILIVARTVEKLEAALKEISSAAIRPSQQFHYISADLTDPNSAPRIMSETTAWNNNSPPDILFCCAGSTHPTLFADTPTHIFKEQMESNYFSSAYMAHAFLQPWLRQKPNSSPPKPALAKHIVFTSSLIAFYPLVGYGPYSPSKTALRTLSDTLSQELLLYRSYVDIRTHTIFPGTIFTAAFENEQRLKPAVTKKLEESDGGQTADQVAASSMIGLERGEELVTTSGLMGYAMKVGMLGSSKRNGWGFTDTMLAWVVTIVMVIARRDMDGTVRKWGQDRLAKVE
ncbi:hypothetical protein ACLMJK_004213 [Lecanora helva]